MAGVLGARQLWLSGLVAAVIASIFILLSSGADFDRMTFGDGTFYRSVAADLDADRYDVEQSIAGSGAPIRYGRIGFPLVLWALSGGNSSAMNYVQPLLMVLSAAAIGIAFRVAGPAGGALGTAGAFVALGLPASLIAGVAEPFAIALIVWAVLALERQRPAWAALLLAGAVLVRENAVAVVAGLVVWELIRSRRRDALVLAFSVVPAAAWHAVVAVRFGHLPLLDPYLRDNGTDLAPLIGTWRALTSLDLSASVVLVGHLIAVVLALFWWRRSRAAIVAAANGLALLFVGPLTWVYPGDALRVASIFSTMFVLSLWVARSGTRTDEAVYQAAVPGHMVAR